MNRGGRANGHDAAPPTRSQTPPHTPSRPAPRVEAILLDDVVEEPSLHADALDSLIGEADPRDVLRALARSRLPELKAERPGLIRQAIAFLFGGSRRTATQQVHALMRDLTSANEAAAKFINSGSMVDTARLRTASTPLYVTAEQEAARATIARYQSERAQHDAAAKRASAAPPPLQAPPKDVVRRADLEAAFRLLEKTNLERLDRALAPIKTALDEHRPALDPRVDAAIATLGDIAARLAALETWTHTAAESQQAILARIEERAAETAALAEQVEALQQPAVLRANERARELAEAEHEVDLARKRAEVTAHRATARRHRERPKTPTEEFAQRAREQLRTATSKRRALDKIRGEIDDRLRQTAARYGEDSEAYKLERDMYDDITTDMEELK